MLLFSSLIFGIFSLPSWELATDLPGLNPAVPKDRIVHGIWYQASGRKFGHQLPGVPAATRSRDAFLNGIFPSIRGYSDHKMRLIIRGSDFAASAASSTPQGQ